MTVITETHLQIIEPNQDETKHFTQEHNTLPYQGIETTIFQSWTQCFNH